MRCVSLMGFAVCFRYSLTNDGRVRRDDILERLLRAEEEQVRVVRARHEEEVGAAAKIRFGEVRLHQDRIATRVDLLVAREH